MTLGTLEKKGIKSQPKSLQQESEFCKTIVTSVKFIQHRFSLFVMKEIFYIQNFTQVTIYMKTGSIYNVNYLKCTRIVLKVLF